jgi:hypothetical protein
MHHFQLIERLRRERQSVKERLRDYHQWCLAVDRSDLLSRPLSLKRSRLDEQITEFRQFHAQLRTRRHTFDSDMKGRFHIEHLLDEKDKSDLKIIDRYFQTFEQQADLYNEQINCLSASLNEFHLEHAHLIDHYAKYLRLYSEHVQHNEDLQFSALQLLLKRTNALIVDHTRFEQLRDQVMQTKNIVDVDEISAHEQQVDEYRQQYQMFLHDLQTILRDREDIFNRYDSIRDSIQDWLITTDSALNQPISLHRCEQLLDEHSELPIEQFRSLSEQLIQFYSSPNLLKLYEQFKLAQTIHHSQTTAIFQEQTDQIIEDYVDIKERILQLIKSFEQILHLDEQYQLDKQAAENAIDTAKELASLEENTILPLNNQQIAILLQNYQVHHLHNDG